MDSDIIGDAGRWDDERGDLRFSLRESQTILGTERPRYSRSDYEARIAELERELQQARAWAHIWKAKAKIERRRKIRNYNVTRRLLGGDLA